MSNERNEAIHPNLTRDEKGRFLSLAKRKKFCNSCGRLLWKKDFYKSKGVYSAYCKECAKEKMRNKYVPKHKNGKYLDKDGRIVEWKNGYKRLVWSQSMIFDLKRFFPCTTNKELAEIFMVSKWSVEKKAKELGLKKDKEFLRQQSRRGGILGGMAMIRKHKKKKSLPLTGKLVP